MNIKILNLKNFLLRKYPFCLFISAIIILGLSVIFKLNGLFDTKETIGFLGFASTILAITFAGFQFKSSHDWNRRQAAMGASKDIEAQLRENNLILDEAFNIIRRKPEESLTPSEIHLKICIKDGDGALKRVDDKLLIDHENDAGKVRNAVIQTLNGSEYLSAGIIEGVFDEEIVYRLSGGLIIGNYFIFKDYINHLNVDMFPSRNGKIYENLKYMALKFKSREEEAAAAAAKINERGHTA